ncbi:MAG: hypothetical protein ACR2FM_04735 [Candidatus Saccharimonadales bacterium]
MNKLHEFHKTRHGHITFGVAELVLVYIFASIAIDTASMWAYLAAIVLFIGACVNFIKFDELKTKHPAKAKKAHARH